MDLSEHSELIPRLRGVSHAAAFLLAVAAAVVLIVLAHGARANVAVAIYGVGLVALPRARHPRRRRALRRADRLGRTRGLA